ncbi:MAG: PIG-L family deacetylase [Bryobacterales bacterium]|nr:PIG-L family deacetylase [Bryobacterales bacterium]
MPTLLALGAHYDDCVFGVPGLLLQAVRKNYRVVIGAIIGDYTNWPPVEGREPELLETSQALAKSYGVEMRFLTAASMRFEVTEERKREVAQLVVDVKPDVAVMLWPQDRHPDHEVGARLSKIALHGANRILDAPGWRPPRRIYQYDNGPGHTIGFEPDTFVDVSAEWEQANEWLGKLMAFVRNQPYDPSSPDGAQEAKRVLAEYRGKTCGARYAEAMKAMRAEARDIL